MAYTPMTNDRRDFDPAGADWSYILDNGCAGLNTWRELVPVKQRRATWPFTAYGQLHGRCHYAVRLAPDWAFYSWGSEYVLASWEPAEAHAVVCRVLITRSTPSAEFGPVSDTYSGRTHLDLTSQRAAWVPDARTVQRADIPADVWAESVCKGGKLLAFFNDACAQWRRGDSPRPVQAHDLYAPPPGYV
jgi:hypothetical protein